MRRLHICLIPSALAVALWTLPGSLAAQAGTPGGGGGSAATHMASYYAYVLQSVQTVTEAYESSWLDQDMEEFTDLYDANASLVVDSDFRVKGPEAIVARLHELWPARWAVRLSIVDFEASGDLGVIYGQMGDAPGKHITLIKRFGDEWRIVRQFLIGVDGEDTSGSP